MSTKNELQEMCQRKRWELPRYNTKQVKGTPPHAPMFISSVEVDGQPYKGDACGTKTLSEQSAAMVALGRKGSTCTHSSSGKPHVLTYAERAPNEFSRMCLIDLENLPQASTHTFPSDCYVIGFVGKTHHYASGAQRAEVELQLDLRVIDCAVKDSADHMLSFEAGRLCAALHSGGRQLEFNVFSRDHAAEATVAAIRTCGFVATHHVDISAFK